MRRIQCKWSGPRGTQPPLDVPPCPSVSLSLARTCCVRDSIHPREGVCACLTEGGGEGEENTERGGRWGGVGIETNIEKESPQLDMRRYTNRVRANVNAQANEAAAL